MKVDDDIFSKIQEHKKYVNMEIFSSTQHFIYKSQYLAHLPNVILFSVLDSMSLSVIDRLIRQIENPSEEILFRQENLRLIFEI